VLFVIFESPYDNMFQTGPNWRDNFCKGEELIEDPKREDANVEIPDADPVYGLNGPLERSWKTARA
jgi:hypothetical protein